MWTGANRSGALSRYRKSAFLPRNERKAHGEKAAKGGDIGNGERREIWCCP